MDSAAIVCCPNLSSINYPINLDGGINETFGGCTNLSIVYVTENVKNIEVTFFLEIKNLKTIEISPLNKHFKFINGSLFSYDLTKFYLSTDKKTISLPEGLIEMGDWALWLCRSLQSISLPGTLKVIGERTFQDCYNLSSIYIPNGTLDKFQKLLPDKYHFLLKEKDNIENTDSINTDINFLSKLANQGYKEIQNNLGDCYYDGRGVKQDYDKAVKWYKLAAEQGYAVAQYNLGYCYYNGRGIKQDYNEGVKWYKLAAEHGNKFSSYKLGDIYYGKYEWEKNGIKEDLNEAIKWYKLAEKQGYIEAKENIESCRNKITKDLKYIINEVIKRHRLAVKQGDIETKE